MLRFRGRETGAVLPKSHRYSATPNTTGTTLASSKALPYLLSSERAQGHLSLEIQGNLTNTQGFEKIRKTLSFKVYICCSSPGNLEEDSRRDEKAYCHTNQKSVPIGILFHLITF